MLNCPHIPAGFQYSITPPCPLMGLIIAWQSSLALSKANCFKIISHKDASSRLWSMASLNLSINWVYFSVGPCNIFTKDPLEVELSILAHALIATSLIQDNMGGCTNCNCAAVLAIALVPVKILKFSPVGFPLLCCPCKINLALSVTHICHCSSCYGVITILATVKKSLWSHWSA